MRATALLGLLLLASCGGSALQSRSDAVAELIERARQQGAQECAPIELAMAESHHDFADQHYAEGNYYGAKDALKIAEDNANEALDRSPSGQCGVVAAPVEGDSDGDGVPNATDDCPRRPEDMDGYADADGCPETDNDADGFADGIDDCPNEPEDRDDFEDQDGCPDVDNDNDGLSDRVDQCPVEAEDDDGHKDDDGCPDCDNDSDGVPECPDPIDQCPDQPAGTDDGCPQAYENVVVTQKAIELKQAVYFRTNKATIRPVSYGLLNEVAQALQDRPKIKVRIEGHTDSRGSDKRNQRLSEDRASAVRDYLIKRGVAADRMEAVGFGESVPIADNRTSGGREQNRRVEFQITSR